MDVTFSSIIKMAGVNPLHKTFYVMILWGYSLAILYTICLFSFYANFFGGQALAFYSNMCVEEIC